MQMTNSPARGSGGARAQVRMFLLKYPDLSADETAEILRFLKTGSALEVGLLTTEDDIRPQLDRFRSAHAREFGLGAKHYLIAAMIVLIIVAASTSLWNVGVT